MTIGIKEIVLIVGWAISLMALIFAHRYRLRNLEDQNKHLRSVIYGEKGRLNIVDIKTCEDCRDVIFSKIRDNEASIQEISKRTDNKTDINMNLKISGEKTFDRNNM